MKINYQEIKIKTINKNKILNNKMIKNKVEYLWIIQKQEIINQYKKNNLKKKMIQIEK